MSYVNCIAKFFLKKPYLILKEAKNKINTENGDSIRMSMFPKYRCLVLP